MPGRGSVRPQKLERVESLKQQFLGQPLAALVGIRGVPAAALQSMRRELRERGHPILVAPNSSLRHAIELAAGDRPSLKPLLEHLSDQTAVLMAEGNPFSLYLELARTRSPMPARGGELAPNDILVPAGTTSFKPGPIVGELQHAGLPAAIEKGKVVLKKDTLIVKAGEPISREVAGMLTRLDIFPLQVGLQLRAVVDGDTFYPPAILSVDLDERRAEFVRAHRRALGLALEVAYPSRETTPLLLERAHRRALLVAVAAGYPTPESITPILARALREARAVAALGEKST
ncbi:MAG TPA: 50S ribosomal protein L10 [Thermoplasmata archaeon]|nr:50S ribosomal protein L10 [Thermoplasmata archaeon]